MRRLLGTMACLALLAALASPRPCFMAMTPSQDSLPGSAHDCCQGLRSTPPACCMGSMAADAAGRMPSKLVVEAAAASPALFVPGPLCAARLANPFAFLGAPHLKAPPPVLRV
jgi:hypothetical protein